MRIAPSKKLGKSYFQCITHRGGGLNIGLTIHFPVNIWDGELDVDADTYSWHIPTNTRYKSIYVNVGLVFWEFGFHIDYNHKPIENGEA